MKRIKIGEVGVDSGQLIICDPCYIDSEWKKEKLEFTKDGFKKAKNNFSYPAVCNKTISLRKPIKEQGQLNYKLGHPGIAVAFPSGYGDGCYPIYGTFNDEGRCMLVEIDCGITKVQDKFFKHETKKQTTKKGSKRNTK